MYVGRLKSDAWRIGMGAFVCAMLSNCAPEDEYNEDLAVESTTQALWSHCADHRQHCSFTGTYVVRYGVNGTFTKRTFTDGVHCTGRAFGVRSNASYHCEVETPDPAAPMPMSMMPYVDESAIPTGDPGVSDVRIRTSRDVPGGSDGTGNFRTVCKFSHMNFDDPIVYPGQEGAAHLHAYFGNTDVDAFSTAESIRNSGNSTCRGGIANRTAYWVPALLDAQGKPQKPDDANLYYKTGYAGISPASVKPFPEGLRMIAGDAKSKGAQPHAWWGCQEYYVPRSASIVDCGVGNHLQMTVLFPQCWDGRNLDSSDHKSHMAYPQNGACPSTHPVPLPEISFNIVYPRPASGVAGWHLSSDMYEKSLPGGYSAHADWFDGWDHAVSDVFVQKCDNTAVDCQSHLLGDGREVFY
jgi:hypothetical protein